MTKIILQVLTEVILIPWYLIGSLVSYLFPLNLVNSSPTKQTPIVFIHGWLSQNFPYITLKRYLENAGYSVHLTNFGWHVGDIQKNARKLKDFLERNNLHDAVLIGASLGALISLFYLQRLSGWKRVNKFISIGGPFYGSPAAHLAAWFSQSAQQIVPGSKFLTSLTSKVKTTKKIICISAEFDELVPKSSSYLIGSKHIIVDVIGHLNLQLSQKTFRTIEAELPSI